jgi:RNA polymerase sigma-70 factor (ECF subfamily)
VAISKDELDRFYSEIETSIYNFALRWTWNPSLAEELVHDAFIRIWRRRDEVDAHTLKGLLYKTVQNLAINERRKARLRESIPMLEWIMRERTPSTEDDFLQRENLSALQQALDSLPSELRETLLMCQFSDMSYDEIGLALGISPGTVGSRKSRALAALKEALGSVPPEKGKQNAK